ncbi:MAG: hypothetical protein AUG51_02325 [Acidobacteria bacterium 13_1_20CM_3_53_8]|nr:MAG: hypothetical protein AUG51_02325 [Acidobacteria bacterium 13_1_20CM_3_53_8]
MTFFHFSIVSRSRSLRRVSLSRHSTHAAAVAPVPFNALTFVAYLLASKELLFFSFSSEVTYEFFMAGASSSPNKFATDQ